MGSNYAFSTYVVSLLLLFLSLTTTLAQNVRQIEGQVIDANTKEAITAVNIGIAPTTRGSQTDANGYFRLNIQPGDQSLLFSHINYEFLELDLLNLQDSFLLISLSPSTINITEIVVKASSEMEPLTDEKAYSTADFLVFDHHLLTLNYHGIGRGYRLQLQDLQGEVKNEINLKGIKHPDALFLSCQDKPYLLTRDTAYQFFIENHQLFFVAAHSIQLFNQYVKPCFGISESALYYQFGQFNGLLQELHFFNIFDQEKGPFRQIADWEKIRDYAGSQSLFRRADGSTMEINGIAHNFDVKKENEIYRARQEKTDFLQRIYFKFRAAIFSFCTNQELVVFNHLDGQIERYDFQNKLIDYQTIEYHLDKGWEKNIIFDGNKSFYTLYKKPSKYILYEINPNSGQLTELTTFDYDHYEKIIIRDRLLYMLANDQGKLGTKNFVQRLQF